MINVVIAEDSPTLRDFLVNILSAQPDIRVVATANDGEQVVELTRRFKPDLVTMDIHMPRLDGFEATRRIMENHPVPIVIVSSTLTDDMAATFRAVEAGAVAFVRRPHGIGDPRYMETSGHLVQTVRLMSQIKVVRRWRRRIRGEESVGGSVATEPRVGPAKLVVIGASTGGPVALQALLANLPEQFPAPILIVQHLSPGFVESFCDWLRSFSRLPVRVARNGESPERGQVYIAPDGSHMGVSQGGTIRLDASKAESGLRPAVSYLFRSAAQYYGGSAIGILLSGMGADGAAELRLLRDAGAVTFAQTEETSIVHGMPGAAIALNAAVHIASPEEIAAMLGRMT